MKMSSENSTRSSCFHTRPNSLISPFVCIMSEKVCLCCSLSLPIRRCVRNTSRAPRPVSESLESDQSALNRVYTLGEREGGRYKAEGNYELSGHY